MAPVRRLLPLLPALLLASCESTPSGGPGDAPGDSSGDGGTAQAAPGHADGDPDAMEEVTLLITGMTCPVRCPKEVRQMLAGTPGVVRVSVDWEDRSATCTVHAGTDPKTLLASLRSPYTARIAH